MCKMAKRMTVQMKSHIFDRLELISVIVLLCNLKLACDTYGIHESAKIVASKFFMKKYASTELNTRRVSKHKNQTRTQSSGKTTPLTLNPQVVNWVFRTYATDKKANTEHEITMFTQPPNKTPSQYAEKWVAQALWYGDVYEEHDLLVNVITKCKTGSISIGQKCGSSPNLIAIGSGSLITLL